MRFHGILFFLNSAMELLLYPSAEFWPPLECYCRIPPPGGDLVPMLQDNICGLQCLFYVKVNESSCFYFFSYVQQHCKQYILQSLLINFLFLLNLLLSFYRPNELQSNYQYLYKVFDSSQKAFLFSFSFFFLRLMFIYNYFKIGFWKWKNIPRIFLSLKEHELFDDIYNKKRQQ